MSGRSIVAVEIKGGLGNQLFEYCTARSQSYRYFETELESIRADLQLQAPCRKINQDWKERIKATRSVCVHVRRGDYLMRQNTFGLCSASYYREAVALIRSRVRSPEFFVFSDDLKWCRANLAADRMIYVDANGSTNAVEELELMRSCNHHIIANSTISWWAAWLAQTQEQIVIAPHPWFRSDGPPEDDLLPDGWIRLNPG
jgi:hypothetical protein